MSNPANSPTGIMRRALRLAEKGKGSVLPNPMVGAVIIKNDERISEGWHKKFGGDHAEIEAIKSCNVSLDGATLFVTLEPCCHHGKTPPCTDTIIKSGIKKVIVASVDPSEKVASKGIEILTNAGLEVEVGLLKNAAEKLNEQFYTFHRMKRPFVTLKVAMSLDGKISKTRKERTFLTGEKAKKMTNSLRRDHQAVLIGSGTALTDNPRLGLSNTNDREPLRIILGEKTKLPKTLQVFRNDNYIIADGENLKSLMSKLYESGIISILVEGGQKVFTSFIEEGFFDRLYIYLAPKVLGSGALDFIDLKSEISLKIESVGKLGGDIMIIAAKEWDSPPT